MEDNKIIDLFWKRSQSAIEEIDNKYGKLCTHIATNILKDIEDTKECINDTYLAAWNSMPDERPNNLSAYICKITRNLALKKYEYNHAKKRNRSVEIAFDELEGIIGMDYNINEKYQLEEIGKIISDLLRRLSYSDRNIFLRRYWFLDSIKDICERFEISESKVKSSLYRTRMKLSKELVKKGVAL